MFLNVPPSQLFTRIYTPCVTGTVEETGLKLMFEGRSLNFHTNTTLLHSRYNNKHILSVFHVLDTPYIFNGFYLLPGGRNMSQEM
jgi:hypothetical protein